MKGKVRSFSFFPLRIDFNAPNGSKEIEWFNSSLSESESNIQINCVANANKGLDTEFSLYTDNPSFPEPSICGVKISSFSNILPFLLDESSSFFVFLHPCHVF